jgi:hypothetical protein
VLLVRADTPSSNASAPGLDAHLDVLSSSDATKSQVELPHDADPFIEEMYAQLNKSEIPVNWNTMSAHQKSIFLRMCVRKGHRWKKEERRVEKEEERNKRNRKERAERRRRERKERREAQERAI